MGIKPVKSLIDKDRKMKLSSYTSLGDKFLVTITTLHIFPKLNFLGAAQKS